MDYKYVVGAEALLLNNHNRRTSHFKISLFAGAALIAAICVSHYQAKNSSVPLANNTIPRVEIINDTLSMGAVLAEAVAPTLSIQPTAVSIMQPMQLAADSVEVTVPEWKTVTVRKGDSFTKIFNRVGAKQIGKLPKQLVQLKATHQVKLLLNSNKQIEKIEYVMNDLETLKMTHKGASYHSEIIRQKTTPKLAKASGTVRQGSHKQYMAQLASIFKDKFNVNALQQEDHISLLIQEEYIGTKKVRTGPIMAAQVTKNGKTYSAVRYADAKGRVEYYTPEGKSLKPGFTRVPLKNYKISSPFSESRMHPVLGHARRHPAVDFSAAYGSPIKATGTGRVVFVGSKGAYGKTIMIEHPNNISTLYAHMSGFDKTIRRGSQVQEGQTIGFVGTTGMTTGPHLHYELRIAGVHKNPMTVALPSAAVLPKAARGKFIPQARKMLAQMDAAPNSPRTKLVSKTFSTAKRKTESS
ncbi:MAG: M23 family metallopeptidase [Gammaproteobacteria bacterium]